MKRFARLPSQVMVVVHLEVVGDLEALPLLAETMVLLLLQHADKCPGKNADLCPGSNVTMFLDNSARMCQGNSANRCQDRCPDNSAEQFQDNSARMLQRNSATRFQGTNVAMSLSKSAEMFPDRSRDK